MKNIEQAKKYAWEQSDWIDHRNGYFSMKECVYFYHKGQTIFNPLTILFLIMERRKWMNSAGELLRKKKE